MEVLLLFIVVTLYILYKIAVLRDDMQRLNFTLKDQLSLRDLKIKRLHDRVQELEGYSCVLDEEGSNQIRTMIKENKPTSEELQNLERLRVKAIAALNKGLKK